MAEKTETQKTDVSGSVSGLSDGLTDCYDSYYQSVLEAVRKASFTDGLFGLGTPVSGLPIHEEFCRQVGEITEAMAAAGPDPASAAAAVRFIIEASSRYPQKEASWTCVACEKHAGKLVEFLTPGDAAKLKELYDTVSPPRRRFPVQKELGKALQKKCAKEKK